MIMQYVKRIGAFILIALFLVACASQEQAAEPAVEAVEPAIQPTAAATALETAEPPPEQPSQESAVTTAPTEEPAAEEVETEQMAVSSTFTAEVWADNWFALYINGELVGEDSVPITTERSFNSETITFEATYPLTIAIEAKDFKETDSGIEYIGQQNQQMGDGGLIAQITDNVSGEVIAVTDSSWSALVIHQAPLNKECEKDADPDATCLFEITEAPQDWTAVVFDDSAWTAATEWSANAVDPKGGYDQIRWDASAQLIWGTDLEVDNTVLFRLIAYQEIALINNKRNPIFK